MVQQFIPLLLMTFFICWFVVVMQFMFQYTDDFIGKGLSIITIGKVLLHAAVMVLPTALPLGILLASLMTFGGMGERLELLAIKSAGTPLHKVMGSLFLICFTLSVGLFFYLNTVVMEAQVRFYQIAFSARDKQPDLEIPEGSFYNGIANYSIFVKKKNHKARALLGVLIYDLSQGFDETRIIRADSGKLTMDVSKTFLTLDLFNGESFQQLKGSVSPKANDKGYGDNVPASYYKEKFDIKKIIISFDGNFKLQSDEDLRNQFVGKNLWQLNRYIQDTAKYAVDSLGKRNADIVIQRINAVRYTGFQFSPKDSSETAREYFAAIAAASKSNEMNLDSLLRHADPKDVSNAMETAASKLKALSDEVKYLYDEYDWQSYFYRTHDQERHRKFTFPVACIIFFFIGAPLGAIIRKGGIGTPMVTSVLLFIIYYMIDTYGYKMGYSGEWPVWVGMWLSSFALLPLGIYLTYQATRDSAVLNVDATLIRLKAFFRPAKKRELRTREVIVIPLRTTEAILAGEETIKKIAAVEGNAFLAKGKLTHKALAELNRSHYATFRAIEEYIDKMLDFPNRELPNKLTELPLLKRHFAAMLPKKAWQFYIFLAVLPLSLPFIWYLYRAKESEKACLGRLTSQIKQVETLIKQTDVTE